MVLWIQKFICTFKWGKKTLKYGNCVMSTNKFNNKWIFHNVETSVDADFNFFSSLKVLMFNRILNKYTSEAGYPEYISRRLLTSLQELPLTPSLLCFLWSASHNVKEGDMCPFAISPHLKPFLPFLSYKCNEICEKSDLLVSAPSPFSLLSFAHSLSLAPPALSFALCSICFEP